MSGYVMIVAVGVVGDGWSLSFFVSGVDLPWELETAALPLLLASPPTSFEPLGRESLLCV